MPIKTRISLVRTVTVSIIVAMLTAVAGYGIGVLLMSKFTHQDAGSEETEVAINDQGHNDLSWRPDDSGNGIGDALVTGGTSVQAEGGVNANMGINFVLYGNVTKKAGRILATLKLMDVGQKRLIKTWDKSFAGRENILDEIPAFAKELKNTITNKEQA